MVNYVIGKVPEEEQKILEEGVNKAVEAVEEILKKGIDIAMNNFNQIVDTLCKIDLN